ncbi:pentatricopeptide repeat-containing protein At4g14190, chloroplastic-like [Mercurialis annua]|uniref:pentatricopeptide repeat-containing protein At4g14190, chloroplastic-like n=1 Tax=Mercurialis annua TaxID=3986 RepID=UPI00215ED0CF|nr:pentatricopeptide repeat-containing protein At4g14190, chloroplastic-like [Mercurialis annua]
MNQISTLQNNFTTFYPYKFDATNPNFLFSKIKITKPVTCFNPSHAISHDNSTKHKTLLVESFHEHQRFKELLARLNKKGSCPLLMLEEDGDWSKDHFWTVIRFLRQCSRSDEILQVFNMWKDRETSRINEFNYEKIIEMLGEEGLMEDAVLAFTDIKTFCLSPSLQVYNSLIHGFARNGKFDDALFHLNQMKETNLTLESDTYDGLIQAYGKFKMYDEMGMCLKKMEMDGCTPDRITYNVLIEEFARAGLLTRMEKAYQRTRMERIDLKSSALIAMVEAYANFGVVDKKETVMKRVRTNTRDFNEDLVRKIALVYIENFMFSRLEKLAY